MTCPLSSRWPRRQPWVRATRRCPSRRSRAVPYCRAATPRSLRARPFQARSPAILPAHRSSPAHAQQPPAPASPPFNSRTERSHAPQRRGREEAAGGGAGGHRERGQGGDRKCARCARSCADAQPRTATTRLSWHCYRGIVPDPGQPNRRRRARVGAGPHALRSNLPLQSTSRPS